VEHNNLDDEELCEDCQEEEDVPAPVCRPSSDGSIVESESVSYSLGSGLDSERAYGVELEVSTVPDKYTIDGKISRENWYSGTDCSVNGSGREYTSPKLRGNDGLRSIRKVTNHLKESSCDHSCGLHLHMDMRGLNENAKKAIALAYHYTCDVWHAFIAKGRDGTNYSRRHNRYFDRRKIINSSEVRRLSRERYVWMNWHAISAHGTLEIRAHQGTCDGYEVQSWVKAHIRFVDFVSKLSVAQVTRVFGGKDRFVLFAELSRIWDDPELTNYYAHKAKSTDRPVRKVDAA
jgi:hypothetical protein